MSEENLNSVVNQEPADQQEAPAPDHSSDEIRKSSFNFKLMREERDAALKKVAEAEQAAKERLSTSEDEDSLIERRDLKKYDKAFEDSRAEIEQTKQELNALKKRSVESSLRSKYSDLDSVVTQENMEKLSKLKPSLFKSVVSNPDFGDQIESAYELINTYIQPGKFDKQERKIAENLNKPRSSTAASPQASDSPLARAGDYDRRILSKEQKEANYQAMRRAQGY